MDFKFGPVESLDAVPEQFRSLYPKEATDGKFIPLPDHKGVADAFLGLTTALSKARQEKKPNVDLSPLAEWGDSPEKIKETFLAKVKELETLASSSNKVNVEKIKADFAAAHQKELDAEREKTTALTAQLHKLLVRDSLAGAAKELGGDVDLLMPFVQSQVEVTEEEGELRVYVIDQQKDRRFNSATGKPMSLKDLAAEMKLDKRYGRLFDSEAPEGGGMRPGGGKGPGVKPPAGDKSPNAKIAAGLSNRGKVWGSPTPTGK